MFRPIHFGTALSTPRATQTPSPRFGMTPEEQKAAREKIFDELYPQLDEALRVLSLDHQRQDTSPPNTWALAAQTIVKTVAQLATFQDRGPL